MRGTLETETPLASAVHMKTRNQSHSSEQQRTTQRMDGRTDGWVFVRGERRRRVLPFFNCKTFDTFYIVRREVESLSSFSQQCVNTPPKQQLVEVQGGKMVGSSTSRFDG